MSLYYLIHLFGVLLSCILEFASTETVKPRIVGGDIVSNRTAFAYQACVRKHGRHHCGGTIIDARHVLTACHCCISQRGRIYEASELTITVGNLLLDGDPLAKTYKVKYIFTHLWYNPIRVINDICVLRISGDFLNWTNEINYIDLQDTSVKSGKCTVSGWGATKFGSPLPSPQLRSIEIPIISWYECRSYYRFLKGKQLCAHEKGKDSCQGDSGGPLICRGRLTGIVSYGSKCGVYPGVYTEVYRYLDWIEEQRRRSSAITISLSFILKIFAIFSILF